MHGIGHLPSTIIKKGTAAKKKALSNAEKVRLNKLKNAANARKNKANRSKNAINASDVALARLLKKYKGARMSTGGIKKAQTGRTMDRGWQEPNSGMNDGSSSTPVMAKKGGATGDKKWIQKATASIKRRGTEGKCTPITKPGCTGRAKALAKTFKKMAKKK